MSSSVERIVLGSRSPRRQELLSLLVDPERIVVLPPRDAEEPSLDDCTAWDSLHERLADIARMKNRDVFEQLRVSGELAMVGAVLTADTVIVGTRPNDTLAVLGQPPQSDNWQVMVREWFERYYVGRIHHAVTAVCVTTSQRQRHETIVTANVRFREDSHRWLEWYLDTGEPIGKAGGYGLQGAGSLFVEEVVGSPSNVIGLPLNETAELLEKCGVLQRASS